MAVSVRKRGSSWEYTFDLAPENGKRKRKIKGGFKTKSEAQKAGAKAYSEYTQTGLNFVPSEISFHDYMYYWLEHYVRVNCVNSTVIGYEKKIRNHILPALGSYYLKNITPLALQNFINDLFNDGMGRNSIIVIKGILTNSLSYAVEPAHFISSSPAIYLKLPNKRVKPPVKPREKKHIYIEKDIWNKIITRFPEGHPSHIPLMLGYKCGFRISEVFGILWDDIDLDNNTITINRQIYYEENIKKWVIKAPKYDSYRTIDIDQELCELLKREKEKQEKNRKEYGIYWKRYYVDEYIDYNAHFLDNGLFSEEHGIEINLLCVREDGSYINSRSMQHVGRVIHGKANEYIKSKTKVPKVPVEPAICEQYDFHSLRHTHATMLMEKGVPFPLIQERLGHTNIEMTEQYMNHVTDTMKEYIKDNINILVK